MPLFNPVTPAEIGAVPQSATQGGTAGSPALTQQWQFQAENTTNANGSAVFGSVFWPGTFGGVVETSWDFGYNSPHLSGYQSGKPQAFFSILPDCGDTHGVEIECTFQAPDGTSCFPFQFVGQTNGADTGTWLFSLPKGDGSFIFGVQNAGGTIDSYLTMSGLEAATAGSPGHASFGSAGLPVTLSVTGALLLSQRLAMTGTAGVSNSASLQVGSTTSPVAGLNAQVYISAATGQNALLGWLTNGNNQWQLITNGTDGYLRLSDAVNARTVLTFEPGASAAASLASFGAVAQFASSIVGAGAVATTATDGFLYLPTCAGTPTGTPTAKAGNVPFVYDTTNGHLWYYAGGAWQYPVGYRAAYNSVVAGVTANSASSSLTTMTAIPGAPSITLPNDGNVYEVKLSASEMASSAQAPLAIGLGTAANAILKFTEGGLSGELEAPCTIITYVTGTGQTINCYAYSASNYNISLEASANAPAELSAIRVA